MKKIFGLIVLVAIVAVGVMLFRYAADRLPEPLPPSRVAAPVAEPAPAEPEVHHPLATDARPTSCRRSTAATRSCGRRSPTSGAHACSSSSST